MNQEDGNVEMIIDIRDGCVIQRFKEPMREIIYQPQNAVDVARAMTDRAFEADTGMKPVGDTLKAELIERHRMTLTTRVSHMLNSMRKTEITDGRLAQDIVDRVMQEIF